MAQTPSDRRRSAPASPGGMQTRPSEAATTAPPAAFWSNTSPLSPFGSRLDNLRQTPAQLRTTITRNGRTYKEINTGIANVLVPTLDPGTSQAEVAANRAAVDRAFYMATNPLAGTAYGLASLAGASPGKRDLALAVGGAADAVIGSVVPRTSRLQRPGPPGKPVPVVPLDGGIRLRETNGRGQAQGVWASIGERMLGTGTKARQRIRPPGWQGDGNEYNEGRAHLLARQLGGSGADRRNLVTMTQNPTNERDMGEFETMVASKVRNGEIVDYAVSPIYNEGILPPTYILMTSIGSKSGFSGRVVRNPAGRLK